MESTNYILLTLTNNTEFFIKTENKSAEDFYKLFKLTSFLELERLNTEIKFKTTYINSNNVLMFKDINSSQIGNQTVIWKIK